MRNIHYRNTTELARCITVFYTQELGTCFADTRTLIWQLLFLGLLKPSLSHLI